MARKQLGSILLKPSESGHAAEIASRGGSSTIVDTSSGKSDLNNFGSGGGSSGRGSSSSNDFAAQQAAEAAATAKAAAEKAAKEEAARQKRLEQQEKQRQAAEDKAAAQTLAGQTLKQGAKESQAAYNARLEQYSTAVATGLTSARKGKNVRDYVQLTGETPKGFEGNLDAFTSSFVVNNVGSNKTNQTLDVELPSIETGRREFSKGTRFDESVGNIPVQTPGTIFERQIDTFTRNGKTIPVTGLFSVGENWNINKASAEEEKYFKQQTNVLEASDEKQSVGSKITNSDFALGAGGIYSNVNSALRRSVTEPTIGGLFNAINYEPEKTDLTRTTKYLESKGVPNYVTEPLEFAAGAGLGILEDVRTKPLKNVALFGLGAGIGAVSRSVVIGASSIPVIGGAASKSVQIGGLAVGGVLTGMYAAEVGSKVLNAETPGEAGSAFGIAGKDISLMGFGFGRGAKSFEQVRGVWNTRGRDFLDITQGEYPSAPTTKQVKMFKKNIIPELGNEPGAFHTTSNKFWKGGIDDFNVGSSELPGTYASTQISTPFSRIPKSGSYKLFPTINDLFINTGKPGVAYLQPKGFRYSPFEKTNPYSIGEQKFNYKFTNPVKEGYADVPLMKSEIESVFRPGSGKYNIVQEKYYIKINDVRVPLDVLKYEGKGGKGRIVDIFESKTKGGKSSYSSPPERYSIINPYGGISFRYSRSFSSKPSRKSSSVSQISSSSTSIITGSSALTSRSISRASIISSSSSGSSSGSSSSLGSSSSSSSLYSPVVAPLLFPSFREKSGKKPKRKTKRLVGYSPSFTSINLGITGKRAYKAGSPFSGLDIRPIEGGNISIF